MATQEQFIDMMWKTRGLDDVMELTGDPRLDSLRLLNMVIRAMKFAPDDIITSPETAKAVMEPLQAMASSYGYDSGQRKHHVLPIDGILNNLPNGMPRTLPELEEEARIYRKQAYEISMRILPP